jgi:hypothetical protein
MNPPAPRRRWALRAAAAVTLAAAAGALACSRGAPAADHTSDANAAAALLDGSPVTDPGSADAASAGAGIDVARVDPCTLLTMEEAEAIVRVKLDRPAPVNLGSARPSCTFHGFPTGPVAKVDVMVGGGAEALLATDRRLNEADPDAFSPVEELGDEAYIRRSAVYFRQGDTWTVVAAVRLIDEAMLREPLIAAGRAVAARLTGNEPDAAFAPSAG